MIGAILTTAVLALVASALATIGNLAIARDFPKEPDQRSDLLLDSQRILRFRQYRIMTNLFYHQALVLWSVLGLLLAYKLLTSF
jgi:hypothetical protein